MGCHASAWHSPPAHMLSALMNNGWIDGEKLGDCRLVCKQWASEIAVHVKMLDFAIGVGGRRCDSTDELPPPQAGSWGSSPCTSGGSASSSGNEFFDHGTSGTLCCLPHQPFNAVAVLVLHDFEEVAFCMHTLPIFCNISVISLLCPPGFTDDCLAAILRHPSAKILRLQGGFSWRDRSSMVTDEGFINAVNSGCAAANLVQLEMTHWGLT